MKIATIGILAVILLSSQVSNAKNEKENTTKTNSKRHELGLIFSPPLGNENTTTEIGVQYKRWVRKNRAIRSSINIGGNSFSTERHFDKLIKDTVFESHTNRTMDIYNLTVGIEMHKQFYKKVFLYAAVDLKAEYQKGNYYTFTQTTHPSPLGGHHVGTYSIGAPNPAKEYSLSGTPFVGVKMIFKRLIIGTELSALSTGITRVSLPNEFRSRYSVLDFDLGNFKQRFFISYRI